ncbi:hypothetical protein [Anaerophaga thermohalophila]|jgi:hypothetical protein|uniref:hypothetical protein n=1 Tax=Anaerophaga thermohalophila TaxID=177400 RepID=UPI00031D42B6|nr:hypothetical protein [Anaerophaga thermohalophila]
MTTLLAYKVLLIKEIFYGLLFKGVAGLVVFIETGHVPKNWLYLALIIIAMFPLTSFVLKEVKKYWKNTAGFVFMALSMFKMLLIPFLIIVLFDRDHENIEAYVIPIVIAYLVLLGMDTKWKIQWLFRKRRF